MAIISCARKHPHYDRFGCGKRRVTADESAYTVVHRASCGAQERDPRRRINQDQPAARRDFLNSTRSPSQPDPSRASASAKSRGSSTSLRRARSTASRFVLSRYLRITSSTRRSSSSTLVRIVTPSYTWAPENPSGATSTRYRRLRHAELTPWGNRPKLFIGVVGD